MGQSGLRKRSAKADTRVSAYYYLSPSVSVCFTCHTYVPPLVVSFSRVAFMRANCCGSSSWGWGCLFIDGYRVHMILFLANELEASAERLFTPLRRNVVTCVELIVFSMGTPL